MAARRSSVIGRHINGATIVLFVLIVAACISSCTALPSLPSYAQHPCPSGWSYNAFDDSCNMLWPKFNRSSALSNLPTFVSYADAKLFCHQFSAELPVIVDLATQLTYYMDLVGNHSGVRWWLGVHADPSVKGTQRWITRTGRSAGFVFLWDTKRNQPNDYDRCVVMHQVGSDASGRVFGGNGKMLTVDCEERHSVVCTKQRVPVAIQGINDGYPRGIPLVQSLPLTLTFLGNRIPNGTLVSMQSMTPEMEGLTLADRSATHCAVVSNVTGVQLPFVLTPSDTLTSSQRVCNGTCMQATITIPADWPVVRGARYSLCFYIPVPLDAAPNDVSEYQLEALGPDMYLEVVQRDVHFLQDVCERRTQSMEVTLGTGQVDSAVAADTAPYVFDSPIEGRYDVQHREHTETVLQWGR